MTVSNDYEPVRTNGNGIVTEFTITWKFQDEADLKVYLVDDATNTPVLQTISTHYTVAINAVTDGGTVTFLTPPAADEDVLIERVVDIVQPTDIPNVGAIVESQLEDEYDNSRIIDQQLEEEQSRMYRLTVADATLFSQMSYEIPTPDAGKGLIWGSGGNSIVNTTSDLSNIDDAVQDAQNAATSAQGFAITAGNHATSAQGFAISASNSADIALGAASAVTAAGVDLTDVEWVCLTDDTVVIESGSNFIGVDTQTLFTFASQITMDITGTIGQPLGLNTGARAINDYFIIALGDTTGTNTPSAWFVSSTDYASFTTSDLPSGYDDYKRIGNVYDYTGSNFVERRHYKGRTYIEQSAGFNGASTSATFETKSLTTYNSSLMREAEVYFYKGGTTGIATYKHEGSSLNGHQITTDDDHYDSCTANILLDSSQDFEIKTSANQISFVVLSYEDDLSIEGQ